MSTRFVSILSVSVVALTPLSGSAASWDKSALARSEFGEVWSGPPLEVKDLAGKVVLVKTWAEW